MRYKLTLTFLAFAVIPVFAFFLLELPSVYHGKTLANASYLMEGAKDTIEHYIESKKDRLQDISQQILMNSNSDMQALSEHFEKLVNNSPDDRLIIFTDSKGLVQASNQKTAIGRYNFSNSPWFKDSSKSALNLIKGPFSIEFIQKIYNQPHLRVLAFSQSVTNKNGAFIGVITLFVDASILSQNINSFIEKSQLEGAVSIYDTRYKKFSEASTSTSKANLNFQMNDEFSLHGLLLKLHIHAKNVTYWNTIRPYLWPLLILFGIFVWFTLSLARTYTYQISYRKSYDKPVFDLGTEMEIKDDSWQKEKTESPPSESFEILNSAPPGKVANTDLLDQYALIEKMVQTISVQVNILAINSTVAAIGNANLDSLAVEANELSEKTSLLEQKILSRVYQLRKSV